jgi:hypothetical protein
MVKSIMTTNNQQANRRVALLIEGNFGDVEVLVATTALQQGQAKSWLSVPASRCNMQEWNS